MTIKMDPNTRYVRAGPEHEEKLTEALDSHRWREMMGHNVRSVIYMSENASLANFGSMAARWQFAVQMAANTLGNVLVHDPEIPDEALHAQWAQISKVIEHVIGNRRSIRAQAEDGDGEFVVHSDDVNPRSVN